MGSKGRKWSEKENVTSRGKRLWELEDRETEEELNRFLNGDDFPTDEIDEGDDDNDVKEEHKKMIKSDEDSFKKLGEFWAIDS